MTTRNPKTIAPALAALALASLWSAPARAQQNASCTLGGSSLVDSLLNSPEGEDESFLGAKNRGLPQIVFVLDGSPNMRSLPQDLDSADVRAAGLGCSNTILNVLTYNANPCVDAKNAKKTIRAEYDTVCNWTTLVPDGWQQVYNPSQPYLPFDSDAEFTGLYDRTQWYVYDHGWGVDSRTATAFPTAGDACTAAGITSGDGGSTEYTDCTTCVASSGYYLPTDPAARPVLSGNWLNFNPPKYVMARRVLKDQFAALDGASRNRDAMLTTVTSDARRCFSDTLNNTGMDAPRDGAEWIHASTQFKPPCDQFLGCKHNGSSGGGRAGFDNAVNKAAELFTSPAWNGTDCTNQTAITGVPSNMAATATDVSWVLAADNTCRAVYMNGATPLREAKCAPYAEALLNAGQAMAEANLYPTLFGGAPAWNKGGIVGPGTCGSMYCTCPRPTIILIAGGSPDFDDNLPCQITGNGCASIVPIDTTSGTCGAAAGASNHLAKVARFLAKMNMMPSDVGFTSPVNISTFVIGIGTDDPELITAAEAGNGQFLQANNASELSSAINEALEAISSAELSFSNTNVTAVQTRSSTSLVVPRFTPRKKPFWPGRLALFRLFSEDACGCQTDPATCDVNGDGLCGGLFFKDRNGNFMASDASGAFKIATLDGATYQFVPTAADALPIWEANSVLPLDASRKIYTVVDENDDGYFDYSDVAAGGQIEFTTANVARLKPYLNLSKGFCERLGARLGVACLDPTECARQVILYVRGFDDFDEDCDSNRNEERPARLGDIFHSSPIIIEPPMSTRSPMCSMGLSTQCLVSLSETVGVSNGQTAYTAYLQSTMNMGGRNVEMRHRDRMILVGANDGMLHAFNFGRWQGADDPSSAINECPDPGNGVCPGYYTDGTGVEEWAFIPPDLLPKLQRITEGRHQFFVDATPMIRDIWVDLNNDFSKQANEFKTVAIVGERRGGLHFTGLDITNPLTPQFRYLFPQPNTMLSRLAGESYADYLPTAPPIGPIRIKNAASTNTYNGTKFEERWVAILGGGYDQARQRGGYITMIDAWYGSAGRTSKGNTIWTFRPGNNGIGGQNKISWSGAGGWGGENDSPRYSFAATPGMVAFGQGPRADANANGYFFDTATVGDTGGRLWALRFNDPDPAKWAGGLIFRPSDPGTECSNAPYFQVTSNVVSFSDGRLQTLIGSGDRFNLRDKVGGECSAQNLVACLRRGCTLKVETKLEACDQKVTFKRNYDGSNTAATCDGKDKIEGIDSSMAGNCCSDEIKAESKYEMKCKDSKNKDVRIKWERKFECKNEGGSQCGGGPPGFSCQIKKETPFDICSTFDRCQSTDIVATEPRSGFYSVKTFDPASADRQAFNDVADATTYSSNAYQKSDLRLVEPFDAASSVFASDADKGWYFDYIETGRVYPSGFGSTTDAAVNERTVSQATIFSGCSFFSTFTPTGSLAVCGLDVTQGATTRYRLHYKRGDACSELDDAVALNKYSENMSLLPEAPDQLMLTVRPDGMISIGLVSVPRDPGRGSGTNTTAATTSAAPSTTVDVGVDRPLHDCRHPAGSSPTDYAGQRAAVTASGACNQ